MRKWFALSVAAIVLAGAVGVASAQMGMRRPQMKGVWSPVVGAGAVYQMETPREGKSEIEFAVVGSQTVDGKPGFWLEMVTNDPRAGGEMIMKMLMVLDAKSLDVKRMIMKPPGEDAMEFPMNMPQMGRAAPQSAAADIRDDGVLIGTESVTTPAGTFSCQHYQAKDKSWDAWVSDKVPPYNLVKNVTKDTTMTLIRVLTNAKSKITGPVKPFSFERP
jgi:hypothetical protein